MNKRRKLLKSILGGVALTQVITSVSGAMDRESLINEPDNNELLDECYAIYQCWKQTEATSPQEYLAQSIRNHSNEEHHSIVGIIENEFSAGIVFEVNGLVLSKSEAAVMASLGYIHTLK